MPLKTERLIPLLATFLFSYWSLKTIMNCFGEQPSAAQQVEPVFTKSALRKNVHQYKANLSYKEFLHRLQKDPEFTSNFVKTLQTSSFDAFFFETPKVSFQQIDKPFEFVLVDASQSLSGVGQDENTFSEHFLADRGAVEFRNLGGDAVLIAPCPQSQDSVYAHLADFTRKASEEQNLEFWEQVGTAAQALIESKDPQAPTWLSTSGLGVYWLHVRLDSRPKYYQYAPYKS